MTSLANHLETAPLVLVTGGSRGIGFEVCTRLLREGYRVHTLARDTERLSKAITALSAHGQVTASTLDLGNRAAIDSFCENWSAPLFGIVHNAGMVTVRSIADQSDGSLADAEWDATLMVNLTSVFLLTRRLLPHVSDGGRIINIASQLGTDGRAGYGAYCASKFAMVGLTKCWAKELGHQGITVNAICPGWVDTELAEADLGRLASERGMSAAQLRAEISDVLELGRFTKSSEVAGLVAYLLSEDGAGVSGRDWLLHTVWNQL